MNLSLVQMAQLFLQKFGPGGDIRVYFAPGRVNLIGEHIDYNGGHVFPCALTVGNYVIARKRRDRKLRFYSHNFKRGGILETSLDDISYKKSDGWINYPKGIAWTLAQKGYLIDKGLDIFNWGNIPGSGLSSSAAVELSFATAVNDMFEFNINPIELAKIAQYSENNYNHMNCGIMDQFACAMGKKDNAIFLNCSNLEYQYVPFNLKGFKIIVTNSNKKHSLASSQYNVRREECEKALNDIKTEINIDNLCQLTPAKFEKYKHLIKDDICRARAKHVVYEEQRTKDAIKALKENDIDKLGELLNESGDSLRYDYDATCFEIDTLVDLARRQRGVYGSRETGGGWGGNTISIVTDGGVKDFIKNVGDSYKAITKREASFAILEVGDGAKRLI